MAKKRASTKPRQLHGSALRLLGAAGVVVVGVALALAVMNPTAVAHAFVMATTRQTQGYTELAFVTSATSPLPSSAPQDKDEAFTFKLANHEQRDWSYAYSVLLTIDGKTTVVTRGVVPLKNSESTAITVHFSMPEASKIGIVSVQLADPSQRIFFRSES